MTNKQKMFEIIDNWLKQKGMPKNSLPTCVQERPVMVVNESLQRWPSYLQYKSILQVAEANNIKVRYATKTYRLYSINHMTVYYRALKDQLVCMSDERLLAGHELIKKYLGLYLKEKVYNNKDIIICWEYKTVPYGFNQYECVALPAVVILPEDIISFSDLPDYIRNKYEEGKANDKVYDLAVKPVLKEIANSIGADVKQYGVSKNTKAIYFSDYVSFQDFVTNALRQALESKLKETGLEFHWNDVAPKEGNALVTIKIPNYAEGEAI